jgi:hypothetical protein
VALHFPLGPAPCNEFASRGSPVRSIGDERQVVTPMFGQVRENVGCVAADDLLDCIQGCGVAELAGRAEEVVQDDGVAVVGLLAT